MQCVADGCTRDSRYKAAQLCQKHYFRKWRYGTTDTIRKGKAQERVVTPNGYIRVYAPDHHLADSNGYVFEHRKVAYDCRGGSIEKCEHCKLVEITWASCHVDHLDEDRRNNASENLVVSCNGCNVMRHRKPSHECRRNSSITFDGETKTSSEWARDPRVKVHRGTILRRKRRGASDAEALFAPKKTRMSVRAKPFAPRKFEGGRRMRA